MSVKITALVKCDHKGCHHALTVPRREMTQVFHFIIGQDWDVVDDTNTDQAQTYCPDHRRGGSRVTTASNRS